MADLSAMYMDLGNSSGRATDRGFLGMQQIMENQLAYQKAREDLEAQRGLRALFAQNPNASAEEVSRYSPQFGMEMNKYAQEQQERSGRMRKTQNEISEQEMKIFSTVGAQVAEKYAPAAMSGQLNPQMLSQFHNEIGNALMQVEQQYGIRPPPGMDVSKLDPMGVLTRAAPFYKSPVIENMMSVNKEQMLSQVPPRMNPEQAYGGVEMGAYGPKIKPPLPRQARGTGMSGAPAAQLPGEYQRATAADLPMLEEAYNNAADVNEKQQIGSLINQLRQQTQTPAQGQFVTPEQEMALRGQEEQQKADIQTKALEERKTAESDIERKQSKQKAIEAFGLVPSLKEVEDLIAGSTSGGKQLQAAKAFEDVTGKSTPGMENIGTLSVIAGRLRDAVNRAPGSQSDKDAIIESLKTGDIANPEIGASQRMKSYKEFVRQMREMIKKETGIDAGPVDAENAAKGPVTVKSRADVLALPKGTLFMGDDGVVHRRK